MNNVSKYNENFIDFILDKLDTGDLKDIIIDRYIINDILGLSDYNKDELLLDIDTIEHDDYINNHLDCSSYLRYCSVYEMLSKIGISDYQNNTKSNDSLFSITVKYIDDIVRDVVFCFNKLNNYYNIISKENNLEIKFINTNVNLQRLNKGFNFYYYLKYISLIWIGYMYNSFIFIKKYNPIAIKLEFIEHCLINYFSLFYKENYDTIINNRNVFLNYNCFENASDFIIEEAKNKEEHNIDRNCTMTKIEKDIVSLNINKAAAIGIKFEFDNILFIKFEDNYNFNIIKSYLQGYNKY